MIAFFPRNIQWRSLFARKTRVNTERVPPGHTIILLKSNKFKMTGVSVNRSILTGVFSCVPSYSLTSLSFPATYPNHLCRLVDWTGDQTMHIPDLGITVLQQEGNRRQQTKSFSHPDHESLWGQQNITTVYQHYCRWMRHHLIEGSIKSSSESISSIRSIINITVHSKYFPVSDWLKPNA